MSQYLEEQYLVLEKCFLFKRISSIRVNFERCDRADLFYTLKVKKHNN